MRYFLILMVFILNFDLLNAQPASTSRIAAVVNDKVITQADLQNRLRFAAINSGMEPTPKNLEEIQPQILRVMIDEMLQLQLGEKYGVEISPEQIQASIKDIEENNEMPPGTIAQILKENNIPFKTFENQMKAQLIWLLYIREKYPLKSIEDEMKKPVTEGIMPSLQVADWEVDQELKQENEKSNKNQYHLAEILLPCDSKQQEESVKNSMNQIIRDLERGAHFQALAQQFSQSPTASVGGDMGWLAEDQLDPEVKSAVAKMKPGQLSSPIRTPYGYQLIIYIEKKGPESEGEMLVSLKQVLLPFPKDVTEGQAREIMAKAENIAKQAKSCAALDQLAKKQYPGAMSKDMKEVSLSSLPEPLQEVINPLGTNKSSSPLLTQDGGLLIMVCDKRKKEKEVFTRENAKAQIVSRKHTLLAKRELRDLRRHAFIDIRM